MKTNTSTADLYDSPSAHRHDRRCWWDHEQARWECRLSAATSGDAGADNVPAPTVDVRDMLVVHTALLREFRLAASAVSRVAEGDHRQTSVVDQHLDLLCNLLHHHHAGEDELAWPLVRDRVSARGRALIDEVHAQHDRINHTLTAVADHRRQWCERPASDTSCALAEALSTLHLELAEHLDTEERTLLPLAAAYLSPAEWHAVGEAGAASVPKSKLPLVFGMFAYEGDPGVLADMLRSAPAPARVLVPRIAPGIYARQANRVHGTRTP